MVDNYCSNLWRYFDKSDDNLPLPEILYTPPLPPQKKWLKMANNYQQRQKMAKNYQSWKKFDPLPCPQSGHSRDKPVKQLKINEIEMMKSKI